LRRPTGASQPGVGAEAGEDRLRLVEQRERLSGPVPAVEPLRVVE
jgi:hypothetical protein